ncbi:MAG: hypothetical protein ACD_4C00137G0006, partial [uncultured bacterium (gcode 4)]
MSNSNYNEQIKMNVPNFLRFQKILGSNNEIITNLETTLKKVYDLWLLEKIGKNINYELWLCLLIDQEIDQK